MKRTRFFVILFFLLNLCTYMKAQSSSSPDDLGVWCYVSVDLPTAQTEAGLIKCTIPAPPETFNYGCLLGPGASYAVYRGSEIDLYVIKTILRITMDGEKSLSIPFDLLVDKWYLNGGYITDCSYKSSHYNMTDSLPQCHYQVIFCVTQ